MNLILVILLTIVGSIIASFLLVVFRGAPYIPSHKKQVRRAFSELRPLTRPDRVVDLGSGDGAVLQVAREYEAKAIGYELNPVLVAESRLRFRNDKHVEIKLQDYTMLTRLPSDVTVVYAFTTSLSISTIGKKLIQWSQHQDLDFVSYGFTFADRQPDKTAGPMHLYHFSRKA